MLSLSNLVKTFEVRVLSSARLSQLIVPGGAFEIDKLTLEDLKAGVAKSSWLSRVVHPAIKPEEAEAMAKTFLAGMTLGISAGALNVSDEWNRIFPKYEFTQPHDFLTAMWSGKP